MPSDVVDVNSWTSPACYPRGSFCPLSHGPSTRYRGITQPDFRLCATCPSCSQAPLCLYTRSVGFHSTRGNLWAPPLLFRRRPPQSNCPPATVSTPDLWTGLGPRRTQAGISPLAPPTLARQVPRLPAILHRLRPNAMTSCSKAPRGLFVLLRETRIFTRTSISPGPSLRQCSTR